MSNPKAVYLSALYNSFSLMTFVEVSECVGIPEYFSGQICLEIGLNMPVPITGLVVDDNGIKATLSFNKTPASVTVPWSAVRWFGTREQFDKEIKRIESEMKPNTEVKDNVVKVDFKARKKV